MAEFECWVGDDVNDIFKKEIRQQVCQNLPVFTSIENNKYCVLHAPSDEKTDKFEEVLDKRFNANSTNFQAVYFPYEINFSQYEFIDKVDFGDAIFCNDVFFDSTLFQDEAIFTFTKFESNAFFRGALFFDEANFQYAKFHKDADFSNTRYYQNVGFEAARFIGLADFGSALFVREGRFTLTKFEGVVSFEYALIDEDAEITFWDTSFHFSTFFGSTIIKGNIYFEGGKVDTKDFPVFIGEKVFLGLNKLKLKREDQISFHSVRLSPHWFVNIDARKFIFENINWDNLKNPKKELERFKSKPYRHHHQLLTKTLRQLSENAEKNRRYEEASHFRKMAFEVERFGRKEKQNIWLQDFLNVGKGEIFCKEFLFAIPNKTKDIWSLLKSFPSGLLQFFYRILSGYGERWALAFSWLFVIWIAFGFLFYTFGEFGSIEKVKTLSLAKSFSYSLLVMVLQRPQPSPFSAITMLFYGLQTVLAPTQLALVALAIRRKFMR